MFSADRKHFNWNRAGTGSEFFGLRVASGLGTSSKYGSELAGLLKFAVNPCLMSKLLVNVEYSLSLSHSGLYKSPRVLEPFMPGLQRAFGSCKAFPVVSPGLRGRA